MKLPVTCTGGGPLIAIPAEFAATWRGTLPPLGAKIPDGWQWGDDDSVNCDYDRACFEMEDLVPNPHGEGGFGWLKPAGTEAVALILDMALPTAFLTQTGGGVIVRGFAPDANNKVDSDALLALLGKVAASSWIDYNKKIELKDGRIFIFDSSYQGCASPTDITAEDGVCVAQLAGGIYSIKYCFNADGIEFIKLYC